MEQLASDEFKTTLNSTIEKVKELNTDVFGIGQNIYRNHPNYWEAHQDEWDTLFKELEVNIEVDIQLTDSGSIVNSFLKEGDQK